MNIQNVGTKELPQTQVPLDAIQPRANGNLRELDAQNVATLKASIKRSGFTSTILIDRCNRIICGTHRLEALKQLRSEGWDGIPSIGEIVSFDSIPCIAHPIDSSVDKDEASLLEIAENSVRKEFSKEEVEKAIQSLYNMGYSHSEHRPKMGEITINMKLVELLNMSPATASRRVKEFNHKTGRNGSIVIQGVNPMDEQDVSNLGKSKRGRPPKMETPIANPFITESDHEATSASTPNSPSEPMTTEPTTTEPTVIEKPSQAKEEQLNSKSDVAPLTLLGKKLLQALKHYESQVILTSEASDTMPIVENPEIQTIRSIAQGWVHGVGGSEENAEAKCA